MFLVSSYEQPLFLNLSNRADLTIDTKLTQKEGVLLKKDYRKNFLQDNYNLKAL